MLSFVDYPGLLITGVLVLCLVIGTLLNAFFNGIEREENAAEYDAGIVPNLVPDKDCVHYPPLHIQPGPQFTPITIRATVGTDKEEARNA